MMIPPPPSVVAPISTASVPPPAPAPALPIAAPPPPPLPVVVAPAATASTAQTFELPPSRVGERAASASVARSWPSFHIA